MHYVNRAAHYLYGTEMEASGAILYHAEAEWMDKSSAMLTQKPAKACYDAQISYDIVPLDYLETAEKNNGRFGRGYKYLVVPACRKLPERFAKICKALKNAGVPVFFVDYAPDCVNISENEIVPLQKLAAHIKESGLAHEYNAKEHLLRIAKFTRGEATSFFVFNEAPNAVQETLSLPVSGKYIAADLLNGVYTRGETADGTVELALEAGQSVILIFGSATEDEWAGFPEKSEGLHMAEIETLWDIDLRETGKETEFKPFRKNSKLFNITGKNGETEFSGEMRYQTKLNINDTAHVELEFENVGVTAQLFVNGKDMGQRICRPYRWDITEAVKAGEKRRRSVRLQHACTAYAGFLFDVYDTARRAASREKCGFLCNKLNLNTPAFSLTHESAGVIFYRQPCTDTRQYSTSKVSAKPKERYKFKAGGFSESTSSSIPLPAFFASVSAARTRSLP